LLRAHGAPDQVGVGEDLVALGDVDLDATHATRPDAVTRRGTGGVAGGEDAGVHLEAGQVGKPVPSQDGPALSGARLGVRVSVRGVRFAVHRPLAFEASGRVGPRHGLALAGSAERKAFSSFERLSAVSRRRSSRMDSTFFVMSLAPPAS